MARVSSAAEAWANPSAAKTPKSSRATFMAATILQPLSPACPGSAISETFRHYFGTGSPRRGPNAGVNPGVLMNTSFLSRRTAGVIAAATLATPTRADVITAWNARADDYASEQRQTPTSHARVLALMHVAM